MDVRPVADDDHDEKQNRHDEESGGLGGVNGMAVPVLVAGNFLLVGGGGHVNILARSSRDGVKGNGGGRGRPPHTSTV